MANEDIAQALTSTNAAARLVAFYLPQFHPVPENDEWWEPGFTEWTNVTRARSLFRGHVQPHLPRELGYYDLRVPETRVRQAELAGQNGIEAFCYYHYWFGGRRLLERPFQEVLESGEPAFPFMLAWANQTWTGIWHGAPNRVLVRQTYPGADDHRRHFASLEPAFHDARYFRIDDKPAFYLYAPHDLPDPKAAIELWRRLAAESGLSGLYMIGESRDRRTHADLGLDAIVPVHLPSTVPRGWRARLRRKLRGGPTRVPYEKAAERFVDGTSSRMEVHPCVIPNWDNTPRSGRLGRVLTGANPKAYESVLRRAVSLVQEKPSDRRVVFIKSWNEWAEGNYLEPDQEFGLGWLRATASAASVARG